MSATRWSPPPSSYELPRDEVHVWRVRLDPPAGVVAAAWGILAEDELARAARFAFEHDRARFIVGRATLRRLLGRYAGVEPARLAFRYGPRGKPELDTGDSPWRFNVGHSRALGLISVVRRRDLGVDVEWARPLADADRMVERYFAPAERSAFGALTASEKPAAFFRGWTRKEAYMKATGAGFALPLDAFAVSLAPGEPPRLLSVTGSEDEPARWSLYDLDPDPGFAAALAVEGDGCRLCCHDFDHS